MESRADPGRPHRLHRGGRAPDAASPHVRPPGTVTAVKALPMALHGVALAYVEASQLQRLETRVVRAMWGPTPTARAKEVIFCLLTPGHRRSPIMYTRYERLV